jgi:hypothetical protein
MLSERVALYHMRNGLTGIEPMTSDLTGADVNFEHRSYHCTTLTAHLFQGTIITSTLEETYAVKKSRPLAYEEWV